MGESRARQVLVNLEDTFFEMLNIAANKEGLSLSSYMRSLLIKDLKSRGMLTEGILMKVLAE